MPETTAPVEKSIFDVYDDEIAGTNKELLDTVKPMLRALNEYDPNAVTPANEHMTSEERRSTNKMALFHSYPFLYFTYLETKNGNPYTELEARISVWEDAYLVLGHVPSEGEKQIFDAFFEFATRYESGTWTFLNPLPPQTREEFAWQRAHALEEFLGFVQDLRIKELTALQDQNRKALELWVNLKIRQHEQT